MAGLAAADAAVLFRSAVKQVCQRRGLLATFMCRPGAAELLLLRLAPAPVAAVPGGRLERVRSADGALSDLAGTTWPGCWTHALPMAVFAAPTVNGYKRFRPYSFAPDRVCWAVENRGALVRVQGSPGDASSHVEMRIGEPAANPYFYLASNIAAGLDGIRREAEPPPAGRRRPVRDRGAAAARVAGRGGRRCSTRTRSTGRRSATRWSRTWS